MPPPYHIIGPHRSQRAVVISVPHAGRYYPPELLANARVAPTALERLEDRYADALTALSAEAGFTVVVADVARAWIDLNRDDSEWDTQLIADRPGEGSGNSRVRAGLGIVPVRLHPFGALWRNRLTWQQLEQRLEAVHRPWHDTLEQTLTVARQRFGSALLFDLHSMPRQPGGVPQMVIGDRHGQTASTELVDRLLGMAEGQGLTVARNAPYAGAYGIARHGRRGSGIEALQLEFDRTLYLNADGLPDPAGVSRIAALLLRLALAAEDWIAGGPAWRWAAE